jgi:hypothetical protein
VKLIVERYLAQRARWPTAGRHILAQFDGESIVVYQAYRPSIGRFAAENGHFGGPDFSLRRMSWIKPNFVWMMYRCGWGMKENQEIVLAVRLRRAGFDEILRQAVPSTFAPEVYEHPDKWRQAVANSQVRLQWDPDHDPFGQELPRRAIQLGLRDEVLNSYCGPWIDTIEDITEFVREQHRALLREGVGAISTPKEEPYPIVDQQLRKSLGMEL